MSSRSNFSVQWVIGTLCGFNWRSVEQRIPWNHAVYMYLPKWSNGRQSLGGIRTHPLLNKMCFNGKGAMIYNTEAQYATY